MVPAQIVFMAAFPQTPNQKIDRKALPAPEAAPATRDDSDFEPPIAAMEVALAELWRELLGLPRIGRRDNFFELGGHSLLAMQLVVKVRDRFGVNLPLKNLFESPTVGGLAEAINVLSWSVTAKAPISTVSNLREREELVL